MAGPCTPYAEGDETELQEIVGQIAVVELAFNGTVEQFTLVDDNGAVYTIIRPPFSVFWERVHCRQPHCAMMH